MANISAIKLPNGTTYNLKDNGALQLTGGSVTGPVSFGDSVSIDEATIGDLVVNGSASFTNNLQANTINGVVVGDNPKFTDTNTVTTATTTGSGNAVTSITASNGALTVTKGATFLTSHQDISGKADKSATVSTVTYDSTNKKITKTINGTTSDVVTVATLKTALGSMPASDVYSWAKASSKPTYTASEVGALPSSTTYVSTITTTAGAHTAISSKSGAVSFNVPTTAADIGIKFDYTTSGNNRAVLQDSDGNLYVTQKDDNTTYTNVKLGQGYGICGSTTEVVDKVVALNGYQAAIGGIVAIRFDNPVYDIRSLNINNIGTRYIEYKNTITTSSTTIRLPLTSHGVAFFMYNGTRYVLMEWQQPIASASSKGYMSTTQAKELDTIAAAYVSKITTTAGAHSAISEQSGEVSFNVPTTAAHVGIKFGYTTSGNNRAVQQDSSGNLYVTQKDDNSNTTYTLTNALSSHKFTWTLTAGGSGSGSTTTTAELVAGSNITLTDDTTNKKITIAATDTKYSSKTAASGGTDVSLVTTGEKYTWNSKTSNTGTITSVKTTAGAHTTVNVTSGAVSFNVPTTAAHVGAVPTTRKVNNKALSSDITLTAPDVGAPEVQKLTQAEYDALTTISDNTIYFITDGSASTRNPYLDMNYPIGSYYETSDANFNPNMVWGGTWTSETITEDEVVGEGTQSTTSNSFTTNWTYRKWKSGIAECWGRCEVPSHTYAANGGYYAFNFNYPTSLFYTTPDSLEVSGGIAATVHTYIGFTTNNSATQGQSYLVNRNGTAVTQAGWAYIHVVGKWKAFTAPTTQYKWHRTA